MITQINTIFCNAFGMESIVACACFIYVFKEMGKFFYYLYKKVRGFWVND